MVPLASPLDGVNLQGDAIRRIILRLRHNDHRLNYLTTIFISGHSQSESHHNQGLLLRYWLLECILY